MGKRGGPPPDSDPPRPPDGDPPPERFLSYEKYVERFARDVHGLQRLWLVPLALCAFWLAIENSYETFTSIKRERIALITRATEIQRRQHRIASELQEARIAFLREGPADDKQAAALARETTWQDATKQSGKESEELAAQSAQLKAQKEKIEKLKEQAVNLTVAGTVMPSRLSYAPSLWLAALFGWLVFFATIRARAQTNLAAAVAACDPRHRPFGLSEESSLWLAPVPPEVRLRVQGGSQDEVSRPQMLSFLGWTDEEERRNRALSILVWAAVLALAARVAFISADVNSDFSADLGLADPRVRWFKAATTAAFAVLCVAVLYRLSFSATSSRDRPQLVSRRQLILSAAGMLGMFALIWNKGRIEGLVAAALSGSRDTTIHSNPRFVSKDDKARRRRDRAVDIPLADPGDVLIKIRGGAARLYEGPVAFHGVGSNGRTRLYARADKMHDLHRIWPRAFRDLTFRAFQGRGPAIPDTGHTASLEAAALALIESGRIEDACDVLLGSCQIALHSTRPNLRLFDLLAGLATRHSGLASYMEALKALLTAGEGGATPSAVMGTPPALQGRLRTWNDPAFVGRWRDPRPRFWGHPFDRIATEPAPGPTGSRRRPKKPRRVKLA